MYEIVAYQSVDGINRQVCVKFTTGDKDVVLLCGNNFGKEPLLNDATVRCLDKSGHLSKDVSKEVFVEYSLSGSGDVIATLKKVSDAIHWLLSEEEDT